MKGKPGARAAALQVLREWSGGGRHAAEGVEHWSRQWRLAPADRAFALDLTLTTLRNLTLLDYWIAALTGGRELDADTRRLLRGGLTEVLLLGVAEHAAVNENVSLAGRAAGLANAVLRRACREKERLLAEAETLEPAVRYSHPAFLLERWRRQFGGEEALALARWNQKPAPVYVRLNRLHPDAENGMAGVSGIEPAGGDFFRCSTLPKDALERGWCYAQDPSTALAPELLDAQPGVAVLDACAAPGGKTALLAQHLEESTAPLRGAGKEDMRLGQARYLPTAGKLIACDQPGPRLRRLEENLRRLRVTRAEVRAVDWLADDSPFPEEAKFDRILLDAPCSNTGVMRRRVDVRWRLQETEFARMTNLQRELLKRCLPLLKPDGRLVYSTCSIDAEENEAQVAWLLETFPNLHCTATAAKLPQRDAVDGAFAAAFEWRGKAQGAERKA